MRKVSKLTSLAFREGKELKLSNTQVLKEGNKITVRLFGNLIAERTKTNLYINNCGYFTNTTKGRLNAILSIYNKGAIRQVKGKWYINDFLWDGKVQKFTIH